MENSEEDECILLECNIDDMNPEIYNYVMDKLFEKKALDVYRTPVQMKKDRLGVILSVLCREENTEEIKEVIFTETTSLGIRESKVMRNKLKRDFLKVNTIYGKVTIKKAYYKGKIIKWKAEYDECRVLADKNNVPIRKIYEEISRRVISDNIRK